MKKQIVTILLLSMFLFLLSSCADVIENKDFETDGYMVINKEKVVPEWVMTIGDNKISFAEYRYYYLNEKSDLDGGNDDVWDEYPKRAEILKDNVKNTLVEVYSIRSIAEENGVAPNIEKVRGEISEFKASMSASEYKKGMEQFYLTEELYEYVLQGYDLYETLFDYYFGEKGTRNMSEEDMLGYLADNYVHVKHILIYPNTTMSDEDYNARINEVLERSRNADDFDALIKEFSDDVAMPSYGYYFTDGEMSEAFSNACKSLEIGEISDLVKTPDGYHVIQRLPIEPEDLSELRDVVYNQIFSDIINERIDTIEVDYSDEYKHIAPNTVK